MNIEKDKLQEYIDDLNKNVVDVASTVDAVVKEQSRDLDDLMEAIKYSVTQEEIISTDAIERYYAELTNLNYFIADRIGRLNMYKAYSKAYLSYSMEKDGKGNLLGP